MYMDLGGLTKLKIMFLISPFEESDLVFKIAIWNMPLMSPFVIIMLSVKSKQLYLFLPICL